MVLKNLFLRKYESMLVKVREIQNVIKRAVKIDFSVPEAAKQFIPKLQLS